MKTLFFFLITISLIVGCTDTNEHEITNKEASLPESFGFNKMGLKAISTSINQNKNTVVILYGNNRAIAEITDKKYTGAAARQQPDGTEKILVLVTWLQKDDPYWFGAKVPGKLLSIETLKSSQHFSKRKAIAYYIYNNEGIAQQTADRTNRVGTILSMKPAVLQ